MGFQDKEPRKTGKVVAKYSLQEYFDNKKEMELNNLEITATEGEQAYIYSLKLNIEDEAGNAGYKIQPGAFRITPESGMQPLELKDVEYFETPTTKKLLGIFNIFKTKGPGLYQELGVEMKRGILLGSDPGVGKSSLINFFLRQLKKENKEENQSCILKIDSPNVSWETIIQMFQDFDPAKENVKFIVLVIEDIGGTQLDEMQRGISSALLNFLDGNSDLYKVPTLILGTTNFLDSLHRVLKDRPGRFDEVMEVEPPSTDECVLLAKNFLNKLSSRVNHFYFDEQDLEILTPRNEFVVTHHPTKIKIEAKSKEEALELLQTEFRNDDRVWQFIKDNNKEKSKWTPAYIKEIVIRHVLRDIPLLQAAREVCDQRNAARNSASFTSKVSSFGFSTEE